MFNAEARWDRPLPQEEALPGEEIAIAASFFRGKFKPLWFDYQHKRHIIKNIFFAWKEKKGKDVYDLFSVSDKDDCCYRLCFSRKSLGWKLLAEDGGI